MKVGIQGGYGAFHEIAANHYFKNEEFQIVPFETFDALVDNLKSEKINYAVLAIENSIAGGMLPNYKLIVENEHFISGEFTNYDQYKTAVKVIEPFCLILKILGKYLKGRKI